MNKARLINKWLKTVNNKKVPIFLPVDLNKYEAQLSFSWHNIAHIKLFSVYASAITDDLSLSYNSCGSLNPTNLDVIAA